MRAPTCPSCQSPLPMGWFGRRGACDKCGQNEPALVRREPGTQPSVVLSCLLALACSTAFYALGPFLLLRDTYFYHLFCGHGWVPYALIFLFCCALWALLLKFPLIHQELGAFDLNLLPEEAEGFIEATTSRQILSRIGRLTANQKSLLLVARVRQGLLRLNQLGTAEKLDDLLRYRAETDANATDSSYSLPRFIIWAIPVLGFVGTVLGISNGVQSFSTLIQNAADLEGLRESLKGVTYGLGQAFETTMIALCMSLFLMLLMSVLQRREDRLLTAVDEYCMEHLLQKAKFTASDSGKGGDVAAFTSALRELTECCRLLRSAQETYLKATTGRQAQSAGLDQQPDSHVVKATNLGGET